MTVCLQLVGVSEEAGLIQRWVGKDYYNPFIRDFVELNTPFTGQSLTHELSAKSTLYSVYNVTVYIRSLTLSVYNMCVETKCYTYLSHKAELKCQNKMEVYYTYMCHKPCLHGHFKNTPVF